MGYGGIWEYGMRIWEAVINLVDPKHDEKKIRGSVTHFILLPGRLEALAGLFRPSRRKPKCDRTATRCNLAPLDVTGRVWV